MPTLRVPIEDLMHPELEIEYRSLFGKVMGGKVYYRAEEKLSFPDREAFKAGASFPHESGRMVHVRLDGLIYAELGDRHLPAARQHQNRRLMFAIGAVLILPILAIIALSPFNLGGKIELIDFKYLFFIPLVLFVTPIIALLIQQRKKLYAVLLTFIFFALAVVAMFYDGRLSVLGIAVIFSTLMLIGITFSMKQLPEDDIERETSILRKPLIVPIEGDIVLQIGMGHMALFRKGKRISEIGSTPSWPNHKEIEFDSGRVLKVKGDTVKQIFLDGKRLPVDDYFLKNIWKGGALFIAGIVLTATSSFITPLIYYTYDTFLRSIAGGVVILAAISLVIAAKKRLPTFFTISFVLMFCSFGYAMWAMQRNILSTIAILLGFGIPFYSIIPAMYRVKRDREAKEQ